MKPYVGAIHVHSDYSHDGHDSLEMIRDSCLARGIEFIGMTEHAEDLIPEVWTEYQEHCALLSDEALQIIPGLEFRFPTNRRVHLLALGLHKWIAPRSFEEFFDLAGQHATLTVLAHPVLCDYEVPPIVAERVDAIEVWNARYNTAQFPDARAIRWAQKLRQQRPELIMVSGLDQHDSSENARLRVRLFDRTPDPLIELKAGRYLNVGQEVRFVSRPNMTDKEIRALAKQRFGVDLRRKVRDFGARLLHRIGVDI